MKVINDRSLARKKLLKTRSSLKKEEIFSFNKQISMLIKNQFLYVKGMNFGCYWPYMGEYNFTIMMHYLYSNGAIVSLPTIVEKKKPLRFKIWRPDITMIAGIYDIPEPVGDEYTNPSVLFVPLVGHDNNGFRLGYGGGYYDITLAALSPRPITIGVGYEIGRVDSILPKNHDIPMDFIITENGVNYFNGENCTAILNKNEVAKITSNIICQRANI